MAKFSPNTLFESVYHRLRSDIIDSKLTPDTKLRIEGLRKKYQISASPLREALNRLAGEGFVNVIGQRGFRVAPVSIDDLYDISRMRIQLECEALSESIEKGDDMWESNIIASYHRLSKAEKMRKSDFQAWEMCNNDFHKALISACTSKWLLRFRDAIYEQHKRYRLISTLVHNESRDIHNEHKAIKDATLARDTKLACEETKKHIQKTVGSMEQKLVYLEEEHQQKKVS